MFLFYLIRRRMYSKSGTYFFKITTNHITQTGIWPRGIAIKFYRWSSLVFRKQTIILYVGYVGKFHDKLGLKLWTNMLDIKQLGPQNNRKNLLKSQDVAYASAALEWIRFRFWFRFQFRIPRILHESSRIGQLRYLYSIDTRVSVRVCSCGNQQCSRSRSLSLSISCSVSLLLCDCGLSTFPFSIPVRMAYT